MFYLLNYTRKPVSSILYDARLAYSMHLAISDDGEKFQALNHNSGVLFVKATGMVYRSTDILGSTDGKRC